jgi:DNA-binding SARP family transcriptional activator
MGIAVLGPLQVDGEANGLSPRDRVVLAALVVRGRDPSSTAALADVLWGDELPASWAKVVHGCVARLRKRLGAAAIELGSGGYRLRVNESEVDSRRFERLCERAREALIADDPERASYLVLEALDLWRGRALPDLEEWETGRLEAARLEGLRMDAEELRVEAETRAGRARDVLEQARAMVAEAPFRERRWALLAVALHQGGRQAEALGALKRARTMLVDELGLDPARGARGAAAPA